MIWGTVVQPGSFPPCYRYPQLHNDDIFDWHGALLLLESPLVALVQSELQPGVFGRGFLFAPRLGNQGIVAGSKLVATWLQ